MNFRVGQRVVCVDPTWGCSGPLQASNCPNLPTKGTVYTVRGLISHNENLFLLLAEITNPSVRDLFNRITEAVFEAHKYRPVVERKTDISVFRRLLDEINTGKVMGWPV